MKAKLLAILCLLALPTSAPPALSQTAQQAPPPPSCDGITPQASTLPGAKSHTYKTVAGRALRLHVYPAAMEAGPSPAIVMFFGGAWRIGDIDQMADRAQDLNAHGMVSVLVDYRVYCRDHTTVVDAVEDARDAYAWLLAHARELNIAPSRMVLAGGSAGGQLALTTAMRARRIKPAALVLLNPAVDLVDNSNLLPALSKRDVTPISPSVLSVRGLPPTVVFHGEADLIVPIETVRAFCRRATEAGATCVVNTYQGQNHGFHRSRVIDPAIGLSPYDDTQAKTLAFLQSLKLAR